MRMLSAEKKAASLPAKLTVPMIIFFLPCLFVAVSSIGLVMPNASALALTPYPDVAGSASALLGVLQFVLGAAIAPIVGVAGDHSAVPMGIVIATLGLAACGVFALTRRSLRDVV